MPTSVSVSRGGVEVHKAVMPEEGPLPMVAYVVESERPERVAVRVLEQLPRTVDRDDVALHADYGGEHWQVGIDGVEFERELEPEGQVRTAFFVDCDPAAAGSLFVAPSIEDVRPIGRASMPG